MRRTTGAARLVDVAEAAGVGTSIASRVLNRDPTVSIRDETRERILQAARELNYRPNALARGLRLARTMSLGIIINLAYYYEIEEILRAVERTAADAGNVTLIADVNDFVGRGEAYRRLLFERRVDGLLIASILVTDEFVRELRKEDLPFVVLARRSRDAVPSVTVDDELGLRIAVDHLAGLGHRRIGYVAGPAHLDPASRRLKGFSAGMRAAGLDVRKDSIVHCALDDQSVYQATEKLLSVEPRPTAFVIWSSNAAVPASAAARRAGLRCPADVSVVAYNESPIADYLDPPLTTVHMPLEEMSTMAVRAVLRIIDGGHPRSHVVRTPPVLMLRGSTAPPSGGA